VGTICCRIFDGRKRAEDKIIIIIKKTIWEMGGHFSLIWGDNLSGF
jgi:hypothetical protein